MAPPLRRVLSSLPRPALSPVRPSSPLSALALPAARGTRQTRRYAKLPPGRRPPPAPTPPGESRSHAPKQPDSDIDLDSLLQSLESPPLAGSKTQSSSREDANQLFRDIFGDQTKPRSRPPSSNASQTRPPAPGKSTLAEETSPAIDRLIFSDDTKRSKFNGQKPDLENDAPQLEELVREASLDSLSDGSTFDPERALRELVSPPSGGQPDQLPILEAIRKLAENANAPPDLTPEALEDLNLWINKRKNNPNLPPPRWLKVRTETPDGSFQTLSAYPQPDGSDGAERDDLDHHDGNIENTKHLFKTLLEGEKGIEKLEYWPLYPEKVKRWLIYTKTPVGYYTNQGEWKTISIPVWKQALNTLKKNEQQRDNTRAAAFVDEQIPHDSRAHWEDLFQKEQAQLPEDLRGRYRFFIKPSEIEEMHPKIRRLFSFKFATEREITSFRFQKYIEKWGKHPFDTGSDAVQIAVLTLRIYNLNHALSKTRKDHSNTHRLERLIKRRKALMKHLKASDLFTYYSLLKDLALRDQVELFTPK